MRLIRLGADAAATAGFVIAVVALEPDNLAVALEGEDVGGDSVEKPAVVGNDDRAAGKVEQRLLQRAQCVDIEIVGRLVKEQHVGARLEHLGQVDAVALTARELTHRFLLIGAAEVEQRTISTARHPAAPEIDLVLSTRDLLRHRVGRNQSIAGLIDITELDGLADPEPAAVGHLLTGDHAKERGFAGTIWANHPDDPSRWQPEIKPFDQQTVAKAFADPFRCDHQIPEPRSGGQNDLRRLGRLFPALRDERFIGGKPRLALRLASSWALPHPFELAFEGSPPSRLLPALLLEPLLLLLEPARVIALERDTPTAVELENPPGHLVEKVAVMGDGHHGARIIFEKALQPADRLRVEMVCRLVEQQQVGPLQQQAAQRHPAALAPGE